MNRREAIAAILTMPHLVRRAGGGAPVRGDYAQIANLDYRTQRVYRENWAPSACCCSIMQMQHYLRTGVDTPLSAKYLCVKAGTADPRDDIGSWHGFSSTWLAVKLVADHGSCPDAMYQPLRVRITPQMEAEAALRKGRYDFLQLADVPDYAAALTHLAANPGDAVLLGDYWTWDGYAIVGVDAEGNGIWVRHFQTDGPAEVRHLGVADGSVIWDDLVYNENPRGIPPEAFMVVMRMRW